MKLIFTKICVSKPIKWARGAELKSEKFIGSPSTFCSRVKWCGDYDLIDWCRAHTHSQPAALNDSENCQFRVFSEHRASCISKTRATRLSTLNRNSGISDESGKFFYYFDRFGMALTTDDLKNAGFFCSSLVNLYHHLLRPTRVNQSAKRFLASSSCAPACLHYRDWIYRVARGSFTHLHQCISFSFAQHRWYDE